MAVTIKRSDPLKGCKDKAQIETYINKLKKGNLSLFDKSATRGWLRGACTVHRDNPKTAQAAAYIKSVLDKEMRK